MSTYYFYTDLESEFNCKRVQALLNGKLPLTNPSRFNDPFDSQLSFSHRFDAFSATKYLGWDTPVGLMERLKRRQLDPIVEAEKEFEQETWKNWKTFCVSEVCDSLLMWSHYGNSHSGICLELEYDDSLPPLPNEDFFEKVRYTTHYPNIEGTLIEEADAASLQTLLLTKSIDWHYEKEWRLACTNAPSNHPFDGLIDSPLKVTSIIFGCRFSRSSGLGFIKEPLKDQLRKEMEESPENVEDVFTSWAVRREAVVKAIQEGDEGTLREEFGMGEVFDRNAEQMWKLGREQTLRLVKELEVPTIRCSMLNKEFGITFQPDELVLSAPFQDLILWSLFGVGIAMASDE